VPKYGQCLCRVFAKFNDVFKISKQAAAARQLGFEIGLAIALMFYGETFTSCTLTVSLIIRPGRPLACSVCQDGWVGALIALGWECSMLKQQGKLNHQAHLLVPSLLGHFAASQMGCRVLGWGKLLGSLWVYGIGLVRVCDGM
jgi:hypothetical protein